MAIYRSNLTAPDLAPYFKLRVPPLQIMGHDMPSDPDFDPNCGYLTHDEAAILYRVAKAWPGRWADIGARLGWTAAHIAAAGATVVPIDPELAFDGFSRRFEDNVSHCWTSIAWVEHLTSEKVFRLPGVRFVAAMIDGDHDAPQPSFDAARAIQAGAQVLVFHDFAGRPIRDAVGGVLDLGTWKARVYWTPNMMAVAWRDDCGFVPPDHVRDPAIDWRGMERMVSADFALWRCS